ncbi:LLM class flavin-dependent oxidoreductase [Streptomyces sp. NBC_01198]|uniref:LLM class flavin-dependent oxidoreductase n=1 Tax=Streptomyces sp. NBC_01198 TaxID=2903769 RepID=UPI002E0E28D4|nr:LLM class flavin-dependent oxidoreductase [Streptomyces sp. NBC_01198]
MSAPTFGLRLPPCAPVREVADFARRAEDEGVGTVWIPDSQFLWHDVWTTAALVADRTEHIGIGVAVTNFETRHIAVTANSVASIDDISGGRVKVAFGTGDSSVKTIGKRPTPLHRMRENVALLRRLLRGEEACWPGPYGERPMRLRRPATREVPVYMAASGPKALALAGEVADGVILAAGTAPHLIRRGTGFVRAGAERAGRALTDLDIVLAAHTLVTEDEADAVRQVKPMCLAMAQNGAGAALRAVGIDIEVPDVVEGVYPDITHAESWDLAVAIADRYIGDDDAERFASNLTLAGTPGQIGKRVDAAAEVGIESFYLLGLSSYQLPVNQLDAFATTFARHNR